MGFYHLEDFSGDIEQVELTYLIRDFDEQNFAQRKAFIKKSGGKNLMLKKV